MLHGDGVGIKYGTGQKRRGGIGAKTKGICTTQSKWDTLFLEAPKEGSFKWQMGRFWEGGERGGFGGLKRED
jgi:hypothetical protein